jgi:TRAP-type uncharacterized transport system fused permease subunit
MPRTRSGSLATLVLSVLLAAGSVYMLLTKPELPCEKRAPLTVLATLAAFVVALAFRQMASSEGRPQTRILILCLLLSAAALFADVSFVVRHRAFCNQVQQDLDRLTHPPS